MKLECCVRFDYSFKLINESYLFLVLPIRFEYRFPNPRLIQYFNRVLSVCVGFGSKILTSFFIVSTLNKIVSKFFVASHELKNEFDIFTLTSSNFVVYPLKKNK